MTTQGDRSPSGTCSVMVSILAVHWDLMIFTRQGMVFFLSDISLQACDSKLPFLLLLLLEMDWISRPGNTCKLS